MNRQIGNGAFRQLVAEGVPGPVRSGLDAFEYTDNGSQIDLFCVSRIDDDGVTGNIEDGLGQAGGDPTANSGIEIPDVIAVPVAEGNIDLACRLVLHRD